MPAVTVSDITVLPRVSELPGARARKVKSITTAPQGFEGEGFPVRRAFAGVDLAELDPFIHLDEMGEVEYAPGEPKGTPWHPHRGFETVTYIIDGIFDHEDNNGGGGTISNGDTQWMTAGAGILHIETPPEHLVMSVVVCSTDSSCGLTCQRQRSGHLLRIKMFAQRMLRCYQQQMVDLCCALSLEKLMDTLVLDQLRLQLLWLHATVTAGAELRLPWRKDYNALVYTMSGFGFVGDEARPVQAGQLAVFADGDTIVVRAANQQESRSPELELFILGRCAD